MSNFVILICSYCNELCLWECKGADLQKSLVRTGGNHFHKMDIWLVLVQRIQLYLQKRNIFITILSCSLL